MRRALAVLLFASFGAAGTSAHAQAPGDEFGAPPPATPPPGPPPQPAAPPAEPDPDADAAVSFALAIAIGVAQEERFDETLGALGYDESGTVFGGDATVLVPLAPWLWLGGSAQIRSRNWSRAGQPSAHAFGTGLLLTAEARIAAGRVMGFAFGAGVGGGPIAMRIEDGVDSPLAPAACGYVRMTTRVGEGAHLFGRFGYSYFEAANIGGSTLDVNLSGVTFGFGVEARR